MNNKKLLWTWESSSKPPNKSSKLEPSSWDLASVVDVSISNVVSEEPDRRSRSTL